MKRTPVYQRQSFKRSISGRRISTVSGKMLAEGYIDQGATEEDFNQFWINYAPGEVITQGEETVFIEKGVSLTQCWKYDAVPNSWANNAPPGYAVTAAYCEDGRGYIEAINEGAYTQGTAALWPIVIAICVVTCCATLIYITATGNLGELWKLVREIAKVAKWGGIALLAGLGIFLTANIASAVSARKRDGP